MSLEEDVSRAVGNVLARYDNAPGMVTRWVAVVETMGADGKRYLWNLQSPGLLRWDALGLHAYATQIEQAAVVHEEGAEP